MSGKEGSVAPKERINIKYIPNTGDNQAEVELPLKMLVVGDFMGRAQDDSIEDRKAININKNNFSAVMEENALSINTTVEDTLTEEGDSLPISLSFKNLSDFSPDRIASKVPELQKLIELRQALVALKGPLGNIPAFRTRLQDLLHSEADRDKLLAELALVSADDDTSPKS